MACRTTVYLPWPRNSEGSPSVELGIDITARRKDIIQIAHKYMSKKGHPKEVPVEDILQEVFLAIALRNRTRSAHDPRKSSFSHYVWIISNNVCCNLACRFKASTRIPQANLEPIYGMDI